MVKRKINIIIVSFFILLGVFGLSNAYSLAPGSQLKDMQKVLGITSLSSPPPLPLDAESESTTPPPPPPSETESPAVSSLPSSSVNLQEISHINDIGSGALVSRAPKEAGLKNSYKNFGEGDTFTVNEIKYTVEKTLGAGGWGSVYKCWFFDDGEKIYVAIKVQDAQRSSDKLLTEVKFLDRLKEDDNVVNFYSAQLGKEDNNEYLFIVQEYLGETTLEDFIKKNKAPFKEKLDVAKKLLEALRDLHQQKIMHCDLKPNNIMVIKASDGTYSVKLIDLAFAVDNRDAVLSAGTDLYLSPEKLSAPNAKLYDIDFLLRSESYTLGLILLDLLYPDREKVPYIKNEDLEGKLRLSIQPLLDDMQRLFNDNGAKSKDDLQFLIQLRQLLEYHYANRLSVASGKAIDGLELIYKNKY